jgi:hypothetical protein
MRDGLPIGDHSSDSRSSFVSKTLTMILV